MSLPTTSSKPAQMSIRSFFQTKSPKYAPPPSQNGSSNGNATTDTPEPPPGLGPQQVAAQEPPAPLPSLDAAIPPVPANILPREASIRPIDDADVTALRRINALMLPVSYPDSFYQRAVDPAASGRFSRVVTWAHDGEPPKVVGALVCRLEPATGQQPQGLYIQSLCLLSPYRGMGLISVALENIVATAVADPKLDVRVVTAHAWTENEEGLGWYEGRNFKRVGPAIRGYYLKLRPDSAWLLQRDVTASVRSSLPSSVRKPSEQTVPLTTSAAVANLPPPPPPPAPKDGNVRPPLRTTPGQSFQNQRADMEWNDLPADMAPTLLAPPKAVGSESTSNASSRSNSTARKKRDRSYPAAAFGGS